MTKQFNSPVGPRPLVLTPHYGEVAYHEVVQNSPEWYALRAGRVGGTAAKVLLVKGKHPSGLGTAALNMVFRHADEKIHGPSDIDGFTSPAMERGLSLEPLAREEYEITTFQTLTQIGYVSRGRFLGVSPDTLAGKDGGVEIKCPLGPEFLRISYTSKADPDHVKQCQWSMYITGRKWWDLCYFHPEYKRSLKIFSLKPDPAIFARWDQVVPAYIRFVEDVINQNT